MISPADCGVFSVRVLDVSIKPVLHSASLHFLCSPLQAVADGSLRESLETRWRSNRLLAARSPKLNSLFPLLHDYVIPMNLTELKQKPITELLELAEQMGLENMARSRKQDVIFSLLKKHAKSGEEISGDGVLEILQDGFGFLRSADASYLAG